jgi:hypothetical protein
MAKLVDALALGASGATHGGSSPLPSTNEYVEFVLTRRPEGAQATGPKLACRRFGRVAASASRTRAVTESSSQHILETGITAEVCHSVRQILSRGKEVLAMFGSINVTPSRHQPRHLTDNQKITCFLVLLYGLTAVYFLAPGFASVWPERESGRAEPF